MQNYTTKSLLLVYIQIDIFYEQGLNNYGYKKFLIIKGKTSMSINQDKIDAESRWDGLHGVITNHAVIHQSVPARPAETGVVGFGGWLLFYAVSPTTTHL